MRRSADRILTTHVGSLPRAGELAEALLKKDRGEAVDAAAFGRLVADAVDAVVARQADIGIDVPSDGEQGKVSYSTYMMDRLTGFGGDHPRKIALDLVDYPQFREKIGRVTGAQNICRAACIGPVAVKDTAPLAADIANLKAATAAHGVAEAFMNAASPGLVTAFQPNQFYPSHDAYLEALAAAMKPEYEAIAAAGFILQLDCPDLAMSHHTGFQDLSEADFLARAAQHVEVMNAALENVPAEQARIHICWGNYEGPHERDIDVGKILDVVMRAKPQAILFEAANPRHEHEWAVWREAALPDDKVLVPGVIDTSTNYVEHPELVAQRIMRFADIVGRDRVMAGTDCGFGTFAGYGKMDGEISYRKLASLVEGAARASERLWGGRQ
jgi:5-methyltetrahydropteroyltriglutamate--homocysteine methyltransferase